MSIKNKSFFILMMVCIFLSIMEISLISTRELKLQMMLDEGNKKVEKLMKMQKISGNFFTAVQIRANVVLILAGIVGDGIAALYIESLIESNFPNLASQASFIVGVISFVLIIVF